MSSLEITEVKIRRLFNDGRLCGLVSIVIDDSIAIHDIRIINGPERVFVAFPSRRESDGTYRDIVHPLNSTVREVIEKAIMTAYEREREKESHEYMQARDPQSEI